MLPYSRMARVGQTLKRFAYPIVNRLRFGRLAQKSEIESDLQMEERLQRKDPIFIYQMGKVASTSIFHSLRNTSLANHVFHAHSFEPFHSSSEIRALYRYRQKHNTRFKLISLVREPVSRNISAFFQNIRRDGKKIMLDEAITISEIKQMFLRNYPHEIPLIWFDNNIKRHFDIDVFEHKFPRTGHLEITGENADLLLMRHDLDNKTKESLIAEFTGESSLKLTKANVSVEKAYAELYAEFQKTKLPLSHLYYLASSKYMKHFFYHDMRQMFDTWSEDPLP